jgi:hypothetical protein
MRDSGKPSKGGVGMCGLLRTALIGTVLAAAAAATRPANAQEGGPGVPAAGAPVAASSDVVPDQGGAVDWGQAASKLFVGGRLGLSFGDVDYIEIAPLVGTWLNPRLSVGGSLIFRYRNDDRYPESLSTTDYGASAFGEYFVWDPIFLHAEVEYLSYEYPEYDLSTERDGVTSVFVGGGVSTAMGGRSSVYIQVLYNLSYSDDEPSPYSDPWVMRFGVGFGF